jgi:hypothetical protein
MNVDDETEMDRHSLDPRQFMDMRAATLPNGTRIIDAYNASGLHFTLLPDRGMDIWTAHYKGTPLTWLAPGSPFPPDEGASWLTQFNGGLLTTCGLQHVGPPEFDEQSGEQRDLHGRFTRLRAYNTGVSFETDRVEYYGELSETRLFGAQLRDIRWYRLSLDEASITLGDRVINKGDTTTPLMLLYHVNVGYPLVREGAELITPHVRVIPRDDTARAGFETWNRYEAASPGFAEQVFFHHLTMDRDGMTEIALVNGEIGLSLQWNAGSMPYFTQWKNTRQGIYVCGVEPGNCIPEGQNAARRSGRLASLAAGEQLLTGLKISILDGSAAIEAARSRISALQRDGTPIPDCKLE